MRGGLEIWKTNKPVWVKKGPTPTLAKLNVSKPESTNHSVVSTPESSPDSSPMSSPKPTVIDVSFAVPKKQKESNGVHVANPGSRFNLLPMNNAKQMKWF
jgi:hypothetical protein